MGESEASSVHFAFTLGLEDGQQRQANRTRCRNTASVLDFRSTCELLSKKHIVRRIRTLETGYEEMKKDEEKWREKSRTEAGITQERGQTAGR